VDGRKRPDQSHLEREIKSICARADVNDDWNAEIYFRDSRGRVAAKEESSKRQMNRAVFATPNLKVFLVGAILIAVVQDFISRGHSEASYLAAPSHSNAYATSDNDLRLLLEEARRNPSSQVFTRLSHHYEKLGDIRKAMIYLHKAGKLAEFEDIED
jgi:hypothetical protein